MKIIIILLAAFLSMSVINCSKDTTKKDTNTTNTTDKTNAPDKTTTTDTTKSNVDVDGTVAKISKYRADGEQKLLDKKFTKKEVVLKDSKASEDVKQKWEKVEGYYEGDKLVRIQLYPHKAVSERTEEFYVMDGKLVFAFIQDAGPKHEGKDMGEPGKEFYFDNGKLIKYMNNTNEKVKDEAAEKKMYESKLPLEVNEITEILGSAK